MKNLRCLLTALVLALSISTVAIAGDIQTPGLNNPPPAPPAEANVVGEILTPGGVASDYASTGETLLLELLAMIF